MCSTSINGVLTGMI